MTNEERQAVIDALKLGKEIANGEGCRVFDGDFDAALAIMRRGSVPMTTTAPAYVNHVDGCHECGWGKVATGVESARASAE